jgi:hypothetical protein
VTTLLQDLRFALRQIRRSPGFAVTGILTLALGIAANVIVFGILQALILRPIDVKLSRVNSSGLFCQRTHFWLPVAG